MKKSAQSNKWRCLIQYLQFFSFRIQDSIFWMKNQIFQLKLNGSNDHVGEWKWVPHIHRCPHRFAKRKEREVLRKIIMWQMWISHFSWLKDYWQLQLSVNASKRLRKERRWDFKWGLFVGLVPYQVFKSVFSPEYTPSQYGNVIIHLHTEYIPQQNRTEHLHTEYIISSQWSNFIDNLLVWVIG